MRYLSAALGIFGIAATVFAADAELLRGPYLQMATPDSIVIVWRTEGDRRRW